MQDLDFTGYDLPEMTKYSLNLYHTERVRPGGFLCAVLSNDLFGAIEKGDWRNIHALPTIVRFIYHRMDYSSWGSSDRVMRWLNGG